MLVFYIGSQLISVNRIRGEPLMSIRGKSMLLKTRLISSRLVLSFDVSMDVGGKTTVLKRNQHYMTEGIITLNLRRFSCGTLVSAALFSIDIVIRPRPPSLWDEPTLLWRSLRHWISGFYLAVLLWGHMKGVNMTIPYFLWALLNQRG